MLYRLPKHLENWEQVSFDRWKAETPFGYFILEVGRNERITVSFWLTQVAPIRIGPREGYHSIASAEKSAEEWFNDRLSSYLIPATASDLETAMKEQTR